MTQVSTPAASATAPSSTAPQLPTPAELEASLRKAPFHRWLNLSVESLSATELVLVANGSDDWFNSDDRKVVHGGIIAALLDIAADWALVTVGISPSPTIDQTVNYLRPAQSLELRVVGRVLKPGRTVSFAEAEVLSGGKVVAVSRASYASVTAS